MAIVQISKIQIRRGLSQDLPNLSPGEMAFSTDTNELWIGNGTSDEGSPVPGGKTKIVTGTTTYYTKINAQTGTTYSPVLSDVNTTLVTLSNGSAITVTIPLDTTIPWNIGSTLNFVQLGTGQVTLSGAVGVTLYGTPGLKARAQYSKISATLIDTNTWLVAGDLAA